MARLDQAVSPTLAVALDYNANSGKVGGFAVTNTSGHPVWARATLTDARQFDATYQPGETVTNLPANVVAVTFDGQGEATITGLARIEVRDPA